MPANLVDAVLRIPTTGVTTNFYLASSDLEGDFFSTAEERLDRLHHHISATKDGDIAFVGEAAGWQGARQSGVPFTSAAAVGLRGTIEPSATAVREVLANMKILDRALLWNAFPLHPHEPGEPRTNRTPTSNELDAGIDALRIAIAGRRVLCIGNKAERNLKIILGHAIPDIHHAVATSRAIRVRHPSRGGAHVFRSQSVTALELWNSP